MVSFKARRSTPELVSPARPTPLETKALSDLDDQRTLRYYETVIAFFRSYRPGGGGGGGNSPDDPAKAIKAALAEALVYYYPVAGRLREAAGEKLVVDCTAEGVVFVEADADVRLEEFGKPLLPPYPCVEELLCDAGDTRAVIGKPLVLMQVTRLQCGGFVIGFHMCHNIADGFGMVQFVRAVAELARGEPEPTTLPVWKRDLLKGRSFITHLDAAYKPSPNDDLQYKSDDVMLSTPVEDMVVQYFLFGPREIATLRSHLRGYLANSATSFELLTAIMWRCRTIALGYEPNQCVRLMITMNARGKWNKHTFIPRGYYGNAHFSPIVGATVSELCSQPLSHTVELVRKTKLSVTKESMESMIQTIAVTRQWPPPTMMDRIYEVSDTKWIATSVTRFGWAELVGGGIPLAGDLTSKLGSDHMRCKNKDDEYSTIVSMLLPKPAMERFRTEMSVWLNKHDEKNLVILSSL